MNQKERESKMSIIEQIALAKDKLDRILDGEKIKKQDIQFIKQLLVNLQLFHIRTKGGVDEYTTPTGS